MLRAESAGHGAAAAAGVDHMAGDALALARAPLLDFMPLGLQHRLELRHAAGVGPAVVDKVRAAAAHAAAAAHLFGRPNRHLFAGRRHEADRRRVRAAAAADAEAAAGGEADEAASDAADARPYT